MCVGNGRVFQKSGQKTQRLTVLSAGKAGKVERTASPMKSPTGLSPKGKWFCTDVITRCAVTRPTYILGTMLRTCATWLIEIAEKELVAGRETEEQNSLRGRQKRYVPSMGRAFGLNNQSLMNIKLANLRLVES